MTYREKYENWLTFDEETAKELSSITDEKEIEDRFYKDIAFGTGGLRGIMGAGSNRMNKYTIGKATFGIANYLKSRKDGEIKVALAYDSRNNSAYFASVAAGIFARCGFKVFLYETLVPVPVLSFTTAFLGCDAGVMITASHNPKEYNGYKVYDEKGCQLFTEDANAAIGFINEIEEYVSIPFGSDKDENITLIGEDVLSEYLKKVKEQSVYEEASDLKIVYTPLHGTGNIPVRRMIDGMNVTVVKEQEMPDGNFPTAPYPNPEIRQPFEIALKMAEEICPDILLATDPDCDRVGIAVHHKGEFKLLTGNDVGILLLDYICKQRTKNGTMPQKPVAVKTIVTSEMCRGICKDFGVELIDVLTGFKFIGEQIGLLEEKGEENRYIFGFEESYGYLAGSYVRDKDAVIGSMLICEMTAYYKNLGMTLVDALNALFEKYGYYICAQSSFAFEGISGMEKMKNIMNELRTNSPKELCGVKITEICDYELSVKKGLVNGEESVITLPKSNVLGFTLENGCGFIVRPSGTEPKIKIYFSSVAETLDASNANIEEMTLGCSVWFK